LDESKSKVGVSADKGGCSTNVGSVEFKSSEISKVLVAKSSLVRANPYDFALAQPPCHESRTTTRREGISTTCKCAYYDAQLISQISGPRWYILLIGIHHATSFEPTKASALAECLPLDAAPREPAAIQCRTSHHRNRGTLLQQRR